MLESIVYTFVLYSKYLFNLNTSKIPCEKNMKSMNMWVVSVDMKLAKRQNLLIFFYQYNWSAFLFACISVSVCI